MKGKVIHNVQGVTLHDLISDTPFVTYRQGDQIIRIDYAVGTDGFYGVSRKSIPKTPCASANGSIPSAGCVFSRAPSRSRRS